MYFSTNQYFLWQKINYSQVDSDVIAKMKGTYKERVHKKKDDDKKKKKKEAKAAAAAAATIASGISPAAEPCECLLKFLFLREKEKQISLKRIFISLKIILK